MLDIDITEVEALGAPYRLLARGRAVGSYHSLEAALSSARLMSRIGGEGIAFVIRLRRLDGTVQVLAASLGRTPGDPDAGPGSALYGRT
jgi:hypothetical protein